MTPLTHAAVGLVIGQRVRSPRLGRLAWPLVFVLAFFSHFLLDSIPHLDTFGPFREFHSSLWLYLGLIGAALTCFLYLRNRDAGLIWILLAAWIGVAGLAGTPVRVLAALALIGFLAYRTKRMETVAYLVAGMLAVSADLVPKSFHALVKFHDTMHYQTGWGKAIFLHFQSLPFPSGYARLHNPYFLMGYGLEFLVEGAIFLTAFWSLSRLALAPKPVAEPSIPAAAPEESGVAV